MSLHDELRSLVEDAVRRVMREELPRAREPAAADEVFLSVSAAARLASVAAGTIRVWMDEGKLRRYRAGHRVLRVRRSELLELLAGTGLDNENEDLSPEALADRHHDEERRKRGGRKRRAPGADTPRLDGGDPVHPDPDDNDRGPKCQ